MTKKKTTTLKDSGHTTRGYSKAKAAFVLEKIEDGMSITAIHRKWPEKCPSATAVFKWARNNEDFKKELDLAYDLYIRSLIDEYDAISSEDIEVLFPSLDGKYAFEARRARMNFLQFMILKVSPFLSKKWDAKTTVVHEGLENLGPQLVIADYGAKDKVDEIELKVVNPMEFTNKTTPALADGTTTDEEEDKDTF